MEETKMFDSDFKDPESMQSIIVLFSKNENVILKKAGNHWIVMVPFYTPNSRNLHSAERAEDNHGPYFVLTEAPQQFIKNVAAFRLHKIENIKLHDLRVFLSEHPENVPFVIPEDNPDKLFISGGWFIVHLDWVHDFDIKTTINVCSPALEDFVFDEFVCSAKLEVTKRITDMEPICLDCIDLQYCKCVGCSHLEDCKKFYNSQIINRRHVCLFQYHENIMGIEDVKKMYNPAPRPDPGKEQEQNVETKV
jgi:hypothetical protein